MKTVKTNTSPAAFGSMIIDESLREPERVNEPVVVIGEKDMCMRITDRGYYGLTIYKETREIEQFLSEERTVDEINDYILQNYKRRSFLSALEEMNIIMIRNPEYGADTPWDDRTMIIDIDYFEALSYAFHD